MRTHSHIQKCILTQLFQLGHDIMKQNKKENKN